MKYNKEHDRIIYRYTFDGEGGEGSYGSWYNKNTWAGVFDDDRKYGRGMGVRNIKRAILQDWKCIFRLEQRNKTRGWWGDDEI
jgi:hypothetical protein